MATTNLNIRIDSDVKNQFNEFCNNIGISMSAAFNLFVKATLNQKKIPFEIKEADPFYSAINQKVLLESIKQINEGKIIQHNIIED